MAAVVAVVAAVAAVVVVVLFPNWRLSKTSLLTLAGPEPDNGQAKCYDHTGEAAQG